MSDINDNSNMSISSSEDDVPFRKRKRYKLPLNSDYNPDEVCERTHIKWTASSLSADQLYELQTSSLFDKISTSSGGDSISNFEDVDYVHSENSMKDKNERSGENLKCSQNDCNPDNIYSLNEMQSDNSNHPVAEKSDQSDRHHANENNCSNDDTRFNRSYNSNYDGTSDPDDSDESDNIHDDEDTAFHDRIMFRDSQMKVIDVMTMVMAYSLRFKVSDTQRDSLIDMLKLLAGPEAKDINISKYRFKQSFDPPDKKIIYHYYCNACKKKMIHSSSHKDMKDQVISCPNCSDENKVSLCSKNYFITIDLKYQLEMLFRNKEIKKEFFKFQELISENTSENIIRDVHDSELYKIINSNGTKYFTYNVGSDGALCTKSGKQKFWPMQIIPNFLPPKIRFKYVLLVGMFLTTKEPNSDIADLYSSEFLKQALFLYEIGIEITDLVGRKVVLKFVPLSFCFDSVARPIFQRRLQFNGYFGCSWCYHIGIYFAEVSGIRYPMFHPKEDRLVSQPLRSKESHSEDVRGVTLLNKPSERGVRGDISLSAVPHINMVWSFTYDYLHGSLAGVDNQLYKQYTKSASKFKLSNSDKKRIEKRMMSITPTHDIHRLPELERGNWHAAEIKHWNLCYSLPCLSGILDEEALKHYSLFVKSLFTLLKTEITEEELIECERDLKQFVTLYEYHFDDTCMTFNVHSVLHMADSVRKNGPLWANSTFAFESNIYQLRQLVNGTNGMDKQMSRKHVEKLIFRTGNVDYSSDEIKNYCSNLFEYKRLSTYFDYGDQDEVVFVGKSFLKNIDGTPARVYKKCIYKHKVFHSIKYTRAQRTNDSTIKVQADPEFGQIINILCIDKKCYFQISQIDVFEEKPFYVDHIKKIRSENFDQYRIIAISDVKCKVNLLNVCNARYLCELPNDFEIQ